MKIWHKILGVFIITFPIIIILQLCTKGDPCELQTTKAEKLSVQSTEPIYDKIFNNKKGCLPKKLILRVPDNYIAGVIPSNSENQKYAPKILTLVTISDESKGLFVRRIDRNSSGWYATKKDSCLAWKWSTENKKQILTLSIERNLQIQASDLETIIFIFSIPFEVMEKKPEIFFENYTWDRAANYQRLNLLQYQELSKILRGTEREESQDIKVFSTGQKVDSKLAKELNLVADVGGVHIQRDLETAVVNKKKLKYNSMPDDSICEIPNSVAK